MTPSKAAGILSVIAGIVACIGTINIVMALFVMPIGIVSGGVAVHKGHKQLGWLGIGLSIFAVAVTILLLWNGGWFNSPSD